MRALPSALWWPSAMCALSSRMALALALLVALVLAAPPFARPSSPAPPPRAPSYWEVHGLLFSLALLLYPRLTLLLCAAFPHYAGPASWLGWLLAPHLTVVVLGMSTYWTSNWILCLVAIPLALAAELFEKSILLLGKDFR